MAELLLELFSEEIPARMQERAAADLKRLVSEKLKDAELAFTDARAYTTPRRLSLVVEGLPVAQDDVREEKRGPRIDAPDKAIEGFLRGNGLSREDCEERETAKGTFLFAVIERQGRPTAAVLSEILPKALSELPWPKSMRWGDGATRWVRPLHSILALLDGEVVPFEFADVASGDTTAGHRFHAPARFMVENFADYVDKLEAAKVMLDPAARKKAIRRQAEELAAPANLKVIDDPGLINEVAGLVEWPVAVMGGFEKRFMSVPHEVLVTTMKVNQKYLGLTDADGALAPNFIAVANLEAQDGGSRIVAGNEYVLTARLADAEFFWQQDLKKSLESRLPELDDMVFHAELGSTGDKVRRIEVLAGELARYVPGAETDKAQLAAKLAKADLVSEMVYEFPEVQGIMGRYYALNDGKDEDVAEAIAQHYSPAGPNDDCPSEPTAVCVALADKLDTLVGFWSIDEKPTGSRDPFALRRAALGVIRLVLENDLRLPLNAIIELDQKRKDDLLAFFAERLKVHLREQGVRHDWIAAVFALGGEDDIVRLIARVEALGEFLNSPDGGNLLTAYRRAANILRIEEKNDGRRYDQAPEPGAMAQPEEIGLNDAVATANEAVAGALKDEKFAEAMSVLARLRQPVDAFFDDVTVNTDDDTLRANRLALLNAIVLVMNKVADFRQIEG
jgi:glycyl-tRNA synthetase beta chain